METTVLYADDLMILELRMVVIFHFGLFSATLFW